MLSYQEVWHDFDFRGCQMHGKMYCVDTSHCSAMSYGIELAAKCRIYVLMYIALSHWQSKSLA